MKLVDSRTGHEFTVQVEEGKGGEEVVYRNLPEPLLPFLANYSQQELLDEPLLVLRSICRMQVVLNNGGNVQTLLDSIQEEAKLSDDDEDELRD